MVALVAVAGMVAWSIGNYLLWREIRSIREHVTRATRRMAGIERHLDVIDQWATRTGNVPPKKNGERAV